jgi:hypothetical protein
MLTSQMIDSMRIKTDNSSFSEQELLKNVSNLLIMNLLIVPNLNK